MRRLVVFGDSWGMGFLRRDDYARDDVHNHFPRQLAESLNLELLNFSQSGHSATCMMNDFWLYVDQEYREGDFVLMIWTEWDRSTIRSRPTKDFPALKEGRIFDQSPLNRKNRYCGMPSPFYLINEDLNRYYRTKHEYLLDTTNTIEDPLYCRLQSKMAYHMFKDICRVNNIPHLQTNSVCEGGFDEKLKWYKDKDGLWDINWMNGRTHGKAESHEPPCYDRRDPNWIEGDKGHNTLIDIVIGLWLKETPVSNFMEKRLHTRNHNLNGKWKQFLNPKCMHPTEEGHTLIAKTLAPYIKRKLEE